MQEPITPAAKALDLPDNQRLALEALVAGQNARKLRKPPASPARRYTAGSSTQSSSPPSTRPAASPGLR